MWKLDAPAVLRAEQEERSRQTAEAARTKLAGALDRKNKEKDKLEKLVALPTPQEALADKYSKFDAVTGAAGQQQLCSNFCDDPHGMLTCMTCLLMPDDDATLFS